MYVVRGTVSLVILAVVAGISTADEQNTKKLLDAIRAADAHNKGQDSAKTTWLALANLNATELTALLQELDNSGPFAANWIRSAIDSITERTLAKGQPLPTAELESFLADSRHNPRARRLAYELLVSADKTAADRLMPTMLDDSSSEMRRDAVDRVLTSAAATLSSGNRDGAAEEFEKALKSARDEDQIKLASDKLKGLGRTVDLSRHFGFVMAWKLIGPFDNSGEKGFHVQYPPEKEIDFAASYPGKPEIDESTIPWSDYVTTNEYGLVDLNKAIGKHMGAVGYAAAIFESDAARPIELRLASDAGLKVWLNGKLLFETEQYHSLTKIDQYIGRGELKVGKNTILLKVCQNEQTDPWAQDWKFQLRVCDQNGTAVLSKDRDMTSARKGSQADR